MSEEYEFGSLEEELYDEGLVDRLLASVAHINNLESIDDVTVTQIEEYKEKYGNTYFDDTTINKYLFLK